MKKLLCAILCIAALLPCVTVMAHDHTVNLTSKTSVRLLGRGEQQGETRTFNWSAAGFEFEFEGTKAEVYVDEIVGSVFFNVSVDGGEARRVEFKQGWNSLVGNAQANKKHVIKCIRSSAAPRGIIKMSKLRTDAPTTATEPLLRKVEFIGDSYTTGYANINSLYGDSYDTARNTDAWQSYAGYAARLWEADYTIIAQAGRGVVSGFSGKTTSEMPTQFKYQELDLDWDSSVGNVSTRKEHDFSTYQPQLVVIWLGANDENVSVGGTKFQEGYVKFLEDVRKVYPDSAIVCMARKDWGYPVQVEEAVKISGGEEKGFYFVKIENFSATSNSHPSAAEAKVIANEIVEKINEIEARTDFWKDGEPVIKLEYGEIILTIDDKKALFNGEEIMNDVAPEIKNNRTMLPIAFVAEKLGARVRWLESSRTVVIVGDGTLIKIQIDSPTAVVNEEEITLDSPAYIKNDRTFLPVRFVSDNLGAQVDWNPETRQVSIKK